MQLYMTVLAVGRCAVMRDIVSCTRDCCVKCRGCVIALQHYVPVGMNEKARGDGDSPAFIHECLMVTYTSRLMVGLLLHSVY